MLPSLNTHPAEQGEAECMDHALRYLMAIVAGSLLAALTYAVMKRSEVDLTMELAKH